LNGTVQPGERDYDPTTRQGWEEYVTAPPRQRPEQLTRAQVRGLPELARLQYDDDRAVWHANLGPLRTPQMRSVHEDLDDVVEANRQDGNKVKGAAVIDAYPGLGKSTIAETFAKGFHERQVSRYGPVSAGGHDRVPVVFLRLTSSTTKRSLNAMLCRFFGLPGRDKGNADELGHRAADAIASCQSRLCVVDDIHFLDPSSSDGRKVANHFKYLANTFSVTFLYVGVGLQEKGWITEGLAPGEKELAQNGRRWTVLGVSPFEIRTPAGRATWRKLLLRIEKDVVLADARPGMIADDLAGYLFARSSGHFASLMALIARGCRRAIRTGAEKLTRDLLDHVRNDAAAEAGRLELTASLDAGLLGARPAGKRTGKAAPAPAR